MDTVERGICPRCAINLRAVSKNGTVRAWCAYCERKWQRTNEKRKVEFFSKIDKLSAQAQRRKAERYERKRKNWEIEE